MGVTGVLFRTQGQCVLTGTAMASHGKLFLEELACPSGSPASYFPIVKGELGEALCLGLLHRPCSKGEWREGNQGAACLYLGRETTLLVGSFCLIWPPVMPASGCGASV